MSIQAKEKNGWGARLPTGCLRGCRGRPRRGDDGRDRTNEDEDERGAKERRVAAQQMVADRAVGRVMGLCRRRRVGLEPGRREGPLMGLKMGVGSTVCLYAVQCSGS